MESKSIYSSEFFHLYNDRSNLACVYREVLEEISTDVSNSTQISQDTSQRFQCELMYFPSNFHKINHLSHSVYIHFISIIYKKNGVGFTIFTQKLLASFIIIRKKLQVTH